MTVTVSEVPTVTLEKLEEPSPIPILTQTGDHRIPICTSSESETVTGRKVMTKVMIDDTIGYKIG